MLSVYCVVGGNRQKSDISGTLDGFGDVPLMCRTVPGDPAGNNLAALRNKKAECTGLFVIDGQVFFCTETAHFTALERASLAWSALSAGA
jgi:alkylation response protein AidB-like acyl-CoA dehydrogenase